MMNIPENTQIVFGLDIGTRSIVGTVGYRQRDRFVVMAQRVKEHETRAMLDGQIHDIGRVAETIRLVKEECEQAIGMELKQVCIAAAGRVLRTLNTHIDMVFEEDRVVKSEDVSNLMSLGIEKAYREFSENERLDVKFYCVGYSVVKYYMNKLPISNLEGHKAHQISADMITTFLPDDVVDGLYRSVELAGLEVANLTLEPIAAISVAIPERFRMLNIALVDVGAGTSDISITREGSIVAYGMIPMAGDALTEKIAMHCLTDFDMAEKIKRDSDSLNEIEYEDIMGLKQTISRTDVLNIIKEGLDEEAVLVADEIKRLNADKPVSAVFVVGGGGIVSGYTERLAQELGISKDRVALRGQEVMSKIDFLETDAKKTSLMVTPIGICLNYFEHINNLIYVTFNGARMKMYDNGHVTVVDVAMQAEFPNDALFPKRGRALTYSVNGKSKIAKGELGEACVITVNGNPGDMNQPVKLNDKITITESTAGVRARIRVENLPEFKEGLSLVVDGKKVELTHPVFCNGRPVTPDYEICEDDRIEILDACTNEQLEEILEASSKTLQEVKETYAQSNPDSITYDDLPEEEEDFEENPVDSLEESKMPSKEPLDSSKSEDSSSNTLTVFVNNEPVVLSGKEEYVFVDIFDFIDFDLANPKGKGVITNYNGSPANYMDPIFEGDKLEIYWKD